MTRVDAATFREALARFASGITVVSVRGADGADYGMTVSSFASLSLHPPLVLACVDTAATVLPHLRAADTFGVSILAADQRALAARVAVHGIDRFEGVERTHAAQGPALIAGAVAHLVCRRVNEFPGGDHVILLGEVITAEVHGGEPLVYWARGYRTVQGDDTR